MRDTTRRVKSLLRSRLFSTRGPTSQMSCARWTHANDGDGLEFFFFHHALDRIWCAIDEERDRNEGWGGGGGFSRLLPKHRVIFGNNSWTIRGESIRVSGSLLIVPCIDNIIRIRARMDGIDYCDDTGMMRLRVGEYFTRIHDDFAIRIRSSRSDSCRFFIFILYLFRRLEKDWELKELKILNKVTY